MKQEISPKDTLMVNLAHYFITKRKYNPVILHGIDDEIWLENMNEDYKIVRIVFGYIHNDEQLGFNMFKTSKIVKDIKRKTFNFKMNVLSIFIDLGEEVNLKSTENNECIYLETEQDLKKYDFLKEYFPGLEEDMHHEEDGFALLLKLGNDISEKSKENADQANKVFEPKLPIVTTILIALNVLIFLFGIFFGARDFLINAFAVYGPFVREGDFYRLITGIFLHADILHLGFNMYSLYVIGSQIESFFGKTKFILIYLFSGLMGSLLSILLNGNVPSIGASGAIFGLMGALAYFGYYYRVYFGNILKSQIIPLILLNLGLGFVLSGIDNFAHVGGLIGGIFITRGLGIKDKTSKFEMINGLIVTCILIAFICYFAFVYSS